MKNLAFLSNLTHSRRRPRWLADGIFSFIQVFGPGKLFCTIYSVMIYVGVSLALLFSLFVTVFKMASKIAVNIDIYQIFSYFDVEHMWKVMLTAIHFHASNTNICLLHIASSFIQSCILYSHQVTN